ncbi:MAG TPA: alpha/beta hydrolase [Cellulomonas sp.]
MTHLTPFRRPTVRLTAACAVATLLLAGCSGTDPEAGSTGSTSGTPGTGIRGLDAIYAQELDWSACDGTDGATASDDEIECATAVVPLDWADPAGETITLAVNRHRATGDAIGSLLTNPGGPGGSGLDTLEYFATGFGADVVAQYDLIGFDPRGVGSSTPVTCLDDQALEEYFATDVDVTTDEGMAQARAMDAELAAACLESTGALLEHVDTASATKDMDVLRAVLGDDTLNYIGFSYGTRLGATYAALFPDKVGRLVLDGAIDPTLSAAEVTQGQAAGFESALRAYVTDCLAGTGCPLSGAVDEGMAQIVATMDAIEQTSLPTSSGRELTGALAQTGIFQAMYSEQLWPYLTKGLVSAADGEGDMLLALADMYYERAADGSYSNMMVANVAINCADYRGTTDLEEMRADAGRVLEVAPVLGAAFGYEGLACADWPVPMAGGLDDYTAAGAAPILVVGTTNDPATPYAWAEKLSQTLGSGVLLTREGEGHTGYVQGNTCIDDAVGAYLLDGTVPAEGTRC